MDRCDICGDIGCAEALITCIQCKESREHIYCTRKYPQEIDENWCCEICVSASIPMVVASRPIKEPTGTSRLIKSMEVCYGGKQHARKGSFNWEKKVATGKTKYMSVEEAIKLSSGGMHTYAHSKFTCRSKLPQPKIRPTTDPLISSKKLSEVQRSVSSLRPSQDPTNGHMQKEQQAEANLPHMKPRSVLKKPSYASLPNALPVAISGDSGTTTIKPHTCNVENVSNNILPDLEKRTYSAAFDAFWKGSFNIQDNQTHRAQIRAHPPSQVRRKIYEFTKKMPEALHFHVVPSKRFRDNLFHEYIPDARDIGLYFFPSSTDGSEGYIFLLEYINAQNLALRAHIADVELLVFTSKLLDVNYQRWKGKYFLWGVFHRLKQDITTCLGNKSFVQPLDDANQVDEGGCIDMDIDMIGGVNVGRIDVPVQRKPLIPPVRVRSEEESSGVNVGRIDVPVKRKPLIPPERIRSEEESSGVNVDGKYFFVQNNPLIPPKWVHPKEETGGVDMGRIDVSVQRKPLILPERVRSKEDIGGVNVGKIGVSVQRKPLIPSERIRSKEDIGRVNVGKIGVSILRKPLTPPEQVCYEEEMGGVNVGRIDILVQKNRPIQPKRVRFKEQIGGVNMGRLDVPVQRNPLVLKREYFNEGPVIDSVSRRGCDPMAGSVPLRSVKTEPHDVYRDRFQSSRKNVDNWEEKERRR